MQHTFGFSLVSIVSNLARFVEDVNVLAAPPVLVDALGFLPGERALPCFHSNCERSTSGFVSSLGPDARDRGLLADPLQGLRKPRNVPRSDAVEDHSWRHPIKTSKSPQPIKVFGSSFLAELLPKLSKLFLRRLAAVEPRRKLQLSSHKRSVVSGVKIPPRNHLAARTTTDTRTLTIND